AMRRGRPANPAISTSRLLTSGTLVRFEVAPTTRHTLSYSASSGRLCLGFLRNVLGTNTLAGFTPPTLSRARAFISLFRSNFRLGLFTMMRMLHLFHEEAVCSVQSACLSCWLYFWSPCYCSEARRSPRLPKAWEKASATSRTP